MRALEQIRSGQGINARVNALDALEEVAARMASKYPPDWLETYGGRIYGAMLGVCFLAYLAISYVHAAWWPLLIPILVPPTVAYIPDLLFARYPGNPRWAHPRAAVGPYDMELVHQIMRSAPGEQRDELMAHYPARTGERVYAVLQVFRDACRH